MTKAPNRSDGRATGRLSRLRRAGPVVVALAGIGLLAAACGNGLASPGVASLGSTTTTTASSLTPGTANPTDYADDVSYAECMRAHGVPNFPDPDSQGNFSFSGGPHGNGVNPNSPQFISANKTCEHLEPNGGQPTAGELQQALAQALKLAQCMRSHGVPNFADPQQSNGNISIRIGGPGLDPNSPQFQAASNACKQYTPGGVGLPSPAANKETAG